MNDERSNSVIIKATNFSDDGLEKLYRASMSGHTKLDNLRSICFVSKLS